MSLDTAAAKLRIDGGTQTEVQRPVGGGSGHSPGQRRCVLDQGSGEGLVRVWSADGTGRGIWDGQGRGKRQVVGQGRGQSQIT